MTDPFRSARLIYRAVEPSDDEDFFLNLQQDPISWVKSNATLARPQGKKDAKEFIKVIEESLFGVVICLPAPAESAKPTPIGAIFLKKNNEGMMHHRFSEIGIDIVKAYQGQGYGSESINWILDWAFETAGLHRVAIRCMSYNEGAKRLYERLGFKLEGVGRELLWLRGKWWDDYQLGMLDREWREMQASKKS